MSAGTEPNGSSRSDEEWERFLRESVEGVSDAPKEPSARARDVAHRLRTQPDRGPEPWRAHPPARPRRRTGWYVVGFLAALALLAVALAPSRIIDLFTGDDTDAPPLAAETARPTEAPPTEAAQRPTLAQPFRGSPAARWADGAAGITTVPEKAEAVGWMNAAEVERALARTRDFLVASSLDPAVLRGERPEKAIALISPYQKDVQALLKSGFRTPGEDSNPLFLFSRFEPSRTHLVGDVVKTRGRITYQEGKRGALEVTADVTYVYPVTPANARFDDEIVRTIVRRELVLSWDDPAKVTTRPGTFSVVSFKYDATNGGCGKPTGYLTPPSGKDPRIDPTAPESDPYDRHGPVAQGGNPENGCGKASRS
ncbi:hypothetical protein ACGFZL_20520 [Streptomyces sp. NPDC048182]|uniref:hypothetical protein n=1 Tax=Streptomyces sp. NPDC048182 TaxID=3365507 RepID=UPI003720EEEF